MTVESMLSQYACQQDIDEYSELLSPLPHRFQLNLLALNHRYRDFFLHPFEGFASAAPNGRRKFQYLLKQVWPRIPGFWFDGWFSSWYNTGQL